MPDVKIEPAPVIWITGLAGVGKTTLARAVVDSLRERGLRPLLLDGDELRVALEGNNENVSHDRACRLERACRLSQIARLGALQGIPVVVATISLFHTIQQWNRANLPLYCEVLLKAELDALRNRRPSLYGSIDTPIAQNVVGIDIAAEFPGAPELSIVQRFCPDDTNSHAARVVVAFDALASQ